MKKLFWILFILIIVAAGIYVDAVYIGPGRVTVERLEFKSSDLDRPVRIVHLSDLHIHNFGSHERKVVERVNIENPDLILITGDLFPSAKLLEKTRLAEFDDHVQPIVEFVSALQSEYGVYVSRGNDDFSDDKEISDLLPEVLMENGINVLTNTGEFVAVGDESLYIAGADFTGLGVRDTAPFFATEFEGENVMQSTWSRENSYSHYYIGGDRSLWRDYTMTGRMRKTRTSKDGIGVIVYSQMDIGYDRFYRLRQANTNGTFHFSPHGTRVYGDAVKTGFSPDANRWVQFRVQARTLPDYTETRAKVWYDGDDEPGDWMAVARDSSADRQQYGSIGLWSGGLGDHYYDDICVTTQSGDTLLYDDFDHVSNKEDPLGWVDYSYPRGAINLLFRDISPDVYKILMCHSPDYFQTAQQNRVDLMLTGHTHGGQIRLPLWGPIYKNIESDKKYMMGLHQQDNTSMYVTRGIGTVLIDVRFLCPPEITVVTLQPGR